MPIMAAKRSKSDKPNEPRRPNRTGIGLHVYVDPAIDKALAAYLEGTEPQVSKTAAVESALREFLKARGHWPPAGG